MEVEGCVLDPGMGGEVVGEEGSYLEDSGEGKGERERS